MNTLNFFLSSSEKRKRQVGDGHETGQSQSGGTPTLKRIKTSKLYKTPDAQMIGEPSEHRNIVSLEEDQVTVANDDEESLKDVPFTSPPPPTLEILQATIHKLKNTNISNEVKNLELEDKNNKLVAEKSSLDAAIDELKNETNSQKIENDRIRSEIAYLITTLTGSQDRVRGLEAEEVVRDTYIETLKKTHANLSDDLALLKGDKAKLQARDRTRDAREIDLEERNENLADRVRELEEMNEKLNWELGWTKAKDGIGEKSGEKGGRPLGMGGKRDRGGKGTGGQVAETG